MRTIIFSILFAPLMLGALGQAQASLIGDTVNCSGFLGTCSSLSATVTDPGVEFQYQRAGAFWDIDIDNNSILVQRNDSLGTVAGFIGIISLSDLDWIGNSTGSITGFTNFVTDAAGGIDSSDVITSANGINIDLTGGWNNNQFLSFDLLTTHSNVPEPATLALMFLGLAGIGFRQCLNKTTP